MGNNAKANNEQAILLRLGPPILAIAFSLFFKKKQIMSRQYYVWVLLLWQLRSLCFSGLNRSNIEDNILHTGSKRI